MIMKQGADTLKRVHFELGGKNPVIVFDDADLDRALDAAIFMIYSLNGERCTSSSSRLAGAGNHRRRVRGQLAERVNRISGSATRSTRRPRVGPLIHKVHFDKVTDYFDIGPTDGATRSPPAASGSATRAGSFADLFHRHARTTCALPRRKSSARS
jgi:5-carboxymethyl-2-hydroxymuconic-semialdehyde dehydrogenase